MSTLSAHNYLPGTDVARCDNSFAWPTEYACQIETFISSRLDIIGELNHNNVSHCVTILFGIRKWKGEKKKKHNFVEPINFCKRNEIAKEDIYALCATFRITLGAADTQHIHRTATTAEKATIIEAVSVNASIESFWCAQREFHTVFVACLRYCNKNWNEN